MSRLIGFFFVLVSVLAGGIADASVWSSVCHVSTSSGQMGTGVVFMQSGPDSYVLTNAHVLCPKGTSVADPRPTLSFWIRGHRSSSMRATTISSNREADIAVLRVRTLGWPERPAPLALVRDVPNGSMMYLLGCPGGSWPTAAEGRRISAADNGYIHFLPAPAGGRSGGPILTADGTGIVGIVTYRVDDPQGSFSSPYGMAIPSKVVLGILKGGTTAARVSTRAAITAAVFTRRATRTLVQYPGQLPQCGPGGCSPQGDTGREWNILSPQINRDNQFTQQAPPVPQQPNNIPAFPTLPLGATPLVDMSAYENRLLALETVPARVLAIEQALAAASIDVAGIANTADQAALTADEAARAALLASGAADEAGAAALEAAAATEGIGDKIKTTVLGAAKTMIFAQLKKFGIIGGGVIAVVLFLFWWKFLKPLAIRGGDYLDGNPDGRFDPRGVYHNVRERWDRRDGKIDYKYPPNYGPYDPASVGQYGPPPGADPGMYSQSPQAQPQPQQPQAPPTQPQPPR